MKAGSSARYQIRKGNPDTLSVIACGRHYPERMDDIAWENDKAAYRAYGPALEASGERAWGYDVFTKSVSEPVVEMRYARELDPQARAQISAWRKEDRKEQADSLAQAISYHVDHGNGMDCYSVGPTLGGGTAALMTADSMLIYPRCYKEYEILDNGPLRFTVRLKYASFTAGSDTSVVETRLISLDCGSHLNRTEVSYGGLRQSLPSDPASSSTRRTRTATSASRTKDTWPTPTQPTIRTGTTESSIWEWSSPSLCLTPPPNGSPPMKGNSTAGPWDMFSASERISRTPRGLITGEADGAKQASDPWNSGMPVWKTSQRNCRHLSG